MIQIRTLNDLYQVNLYTQKYVEWSLSYDRYTHHILKNKTLAF